MGDQQTQEPNDVTWEQGGGKNFRHKGTGKWKTLRGQIDDIEEQIRIGGKRTRNTLAKKLKHLRLKLNEKGDNDSQRPKGGFQNPNQR